MVPTASIDGAAAGLLRLARAGSHVTEAYIQLLCPACNKNWERTPRDLPAHDEQFECPDCGERRPTAEFTRTARDLETLRELQE